MKLVDMTVCVWIQYSMLWFIFVSLELDQQGKLREVELPQLAQEVHPLPGLIDDEVDVGCLL